MSAIDELFGNNAAQPPETPPAAPVQPTQDVQPIEAQVTPEPREEVTSEARPGYVPLQGLLSERDKRKAAEADAQQRAAELEALRKEVEALKAPKPEPMTLPDPMVDPEGYANALRQQNNQIALNAKLFASEGYARQQHGAVVDEALAWLKPRMGTQEHLRIMNAQHPYQDLIDAYKRDKALQELGDPLTARQRLEAEIREKLLAEMQTQPQQPAAIVPQQRAAPPQSLNSVTGTGPQPQRIKSPLESVFGV
jgi:hypothetical protein